MTIPATTTIAWIDGGYDVCIVAGETLVTARLYRTEEPDGWYIEQGGRLQRAEPTLTVALRILQNRAISLEQSRVAIVAGEARPAVEQARVAGVALAARFAC